MFSGLLYLVCPSNFVFTHLCSFLHVLHYNITRRLPVQVRSTHTQFILVLYAVIEFCFFNQIRQVKMFWLCSSWCAHQASTSYSVTIATLGLIQKDGKGAAISALWCTTI